jgi:hypothetical protein
MTVGTAGAGTAGELAYLTREDAALACYLLILREFMHQLGFDRIAVVADTPEH